MKKTIMLFLLIIAVFNSACTRNLKDTGTNQPQRVICSEIEVREKVLIDKEGLSIELLHADSGLSSGIKKISILFNSKKEIFIDEIEETLLENGRKKYLITNKNKMYDEVLGNIKMSDYMSILIEDDKGNSYTAIVLDNKRLLGNGE